jgi:signal transduction histidine kinase
MGIGLSLCRSIVESHMGRMKAQNIYNADAIVGCCFTFWIPIAGPLSAAPIKRADPSTMQASS